MKNNENGITITKYNKNGKEYLYWSCHYRDQNNKQHTKTFPYTKEGKVMAEAFHEDLIKKKKQGIELSTQILTGQCVLDYISLYKIKKVRDSTCQRLLTRSKKLKPIENIPIEKLTTEMIQQWYNGLLESGLHPRTANSTLSLLANALQKAKANKKILYNPAENIEKARVKKTEMQILTTQQLKDIFDTIKRMKKGITYNDGRSNRFGKHFRPAHDYTLLILMLVTTGVRISELLALEWKNIDLENNLITIDKTKTGGNGQYTDAPKTERGKRTFPILAHIVRRKLRNKKPQAVQEDEKYLFSTRYGKGKGNMLQYKNVYKVMRHIFEESGIELKPRQAFHIFRHTFASLMIRKCGDVIPIPSLSRIMGHSSPYVTASFYLHSADDDNQRIMREMRERRETRKKKPNE